MAKYQITSVEQHSNADQYTLWMRDVDINAVGYKGRESKGTEAEIREQLKPYNFSKNELDNQFQNARNARRDAKVMSFRVLGLIKAGNNPDDFTMFLKDTENTKKGHMWRDETGTEEVLRSAMTKGGMPTPKIDALFEAARAAASS